MGRSAKYARLVLALAPNEVLMELSIRVELLSEEAGLALLGLGVLFVRGQVEDQIGDDEGLCWFVKPSDVLLAKAGEVNSVDLLVGGVGIRNTNIGVWNQEPSHQPQSRTGFRNQVCRLAIIRYQWRWTGVWRFLNTHFHRISSARAFSSRVESRLRSSLPQGSSSSSRLFAKGSIRVSHGDVWGYKRGGKIHALKKKW